MSSKSSTQRLAPLPLPPGISQSYIHCPSNSLTYHILEAGTPKKPLLLLLHGFPELAFSWRKTMLPLAAGGYRVVAPDQRGYGRTTGWDESSFSAVDLSQFTMTNVVRDMVILVSALGYAKVHCVIGHDFGAVVASMCALMRPDLFERVVTMSHPFKEPGPLPFNIRDPDAEIEEARDIQKELASLPEPRKHYKWYNSTSLAPINWACPGQGLHEFLRGYLHLKSADWEGNKPHPLAAWEAGELAKMPGYYIMPFHSSMPEVVAELMEGEDEKKTTRWMSEEDLDVYVREWGRTGFQGGLNWYRSQTDPKMARDMELFSRRKIEVPALFLSGEKDWGNYQQPGALENLDSACSKFRGVKFVEHAGHWPQQEQPEIVVEGILAFLKSSH
ncbi:alpha/beta-hydrolase [Mytilinidion resinicola]|uniref:Alpha/beta-hydrolase n=1 Tax=Mytilinidion resinicola TaxID=574789 RepID=A0A6A6Y3F5_9PEZI|nr:alpha/beta-hydrolase [Mytilinidion resinicola]KAF2803366.1 alpha/beta-hydrolase [Mytilinidion resinicola]